MTMWPAAPLDSLIDAPQVWSGSGLRTALDRPCAPRIVCVRRDADRPEPLPITLDPKLAASCCWILVAVQPVAPELAADFRALARARLDGGAQETRNAMHASAIFGPATAPHHQN